VECSRAHEEMCARAHDGTCRDTNAIVVHTDDEHGSTQATTEGTHGGYGLRSQTVECAHKQRAQADQGEGTCEIQQRRVGMCVRMGGP